jgi:hypothetical protein
MIIILKVIMIEIMKALMITIHLMKMKIKLILKILYSHLY